MMNKRGDGFDILVENLVFLIIIALFFAAALFFVVRAGSQVTVAEQRYCKQIALAIDKARPGTDIIIDISELYDLAEKNHFEEDPVRINNPENKVQIRVVNGKGYEYEFFNSANIVWDFEDEKIRIGVIENE